MLALPALGQVVPAFTAAVELDVAKTGNDIANETKRMSHDLLMAFMLDRTFLQSNSQSGIKLHVQEEGGSELKTKCVVRDSNPRPGD